VPMNKGLLGHARMPSDARSNENARSMTAFLRMRACALRSEGKQKQSSLVEEFKPPAPRSGAPKSEKKMSEPPYADDIVQVPSPYGALIDAACARDAAWFEQHPEARQYDRAVHPGEFWPADVPPPPRGFHRRVLVTLLGPGVRARHLTLLNAWKIRRR
jgi:hypothetical protein